MPSYEDSTPTWVNVIAKITATLVLLTSITYLSTNAWSIAHETRTYNNNSTSTPHNYKVAVSCYAVTITATLIQSISSLTLLFKCTDNLKKPSYRWIIVQITMLILVTLSFLIPYTFNASGGQESASNFVKKTNKDFREKTRDLNFYRHDHSNTYAFFLHFITVVVGSILVGLVVRFGTKSGYQAVR